MNRHIDGRSIRELIKKLREAIPQLTLRTTFITGLPGESEAEFSELCEFVKEAGFERMGVFSYAPEPGTPAAEMTPQIPQETADARAAELMKLQAEIMKKADRKLIGSTMRVLVDYIDEQVAVARGSNDAPDIDNVIQFNAPRGLKAGDFADVVIVKACRGGLWAEKKRKSAR